ncbi:hypothetical protein G0Q06_05870 [Puniceicoccales bacterium CK1056]|uniref:Uncharacterized protein n=1 Tax=Oceanipulchritudo coccoides TaxID=2706888 RepID=A0A6B2LZ32_9BACT|nr:hypothetical protein [Oceanipulchritudo coccoides]NDV61971.1 hypothetical protein [Oceanipulchritudo coccoides]
MRRFSLITTACLFTFTLLMGAAEPDTKPVVGDLMEDVGTFIDAGNGLRLQLTLKDKHLVAKFVDSEDKLVKNPASSILLIIDDTTHRDDKWRTVLKPVGEIELTGQRAFYGPPNFRAKIIVRFAKGPAATFPKTPLELTRNM